MAQLSKGDTFADTQQLTATRLNQLVDSATLLVGAITDQPAITANTLEATDTTIVNDAGVLKEATIGDFFGSGLPLVSATLTSTANKDITITPNDGVIVAGSTYTSSDGLTVTVTTLVAHGLLVNNVVLISAAGSGYNGTFRISAVTSLTFQYVMPLLTAATLTPTATACNYTRKASSLIAGNEVVNGTQFVTGAIESPTIKSTTAAEFNLSTAKTSNVTTAMQFSGVPVMGLASIAETTIPFFQCNATTAGGLSSTCNQWATVTTLSSLTKTDKEMWVIQFDIPFYYYSLYSAKLRIIQVSNNSVLAMNLFFLQGFLNYQYMQCRLEAVIPVGTIFTADSIRLEAFYAATAVNASAIMNIGYGGSMTDSTITRVGRIIKYNKP